MIHPQATVPWSAAFGVNSRTGDIGVELEIEGDNLPTEEIESWVVKGEGSLRGRNGRQVQAGDNDTPYEYVLGRPSMFKNLERKLRRLEEVLTSPGKVVRLTDRGSTHIHINMTEYSIREIIGFLIIFTCIEPVLLRYCGPTRNGNLFCLPSYETGDWAETVERIGHAVTGRIRDYWPVRRGKYACLNTDTLAQFGSLEVRCFPNSISTQSIMKWAQWLMNIRSLARDWDDDTYQSLIDRAYDNPGWLLKTVFENESLRGCCFPNPPEELIRFGVEHAYEIARGAHYFLDWKEETPKKKPKKKSWDDEGWAFHGLQTADPPPEPPPTVAWVEDDEFDRDFFDEPEMPR